MFEEANVEVHQQTDPHTLKLQVGQNLSFVNRFDPVDRSKFDNDGVSHKKIYPKPIAQNKIFVMNRNRVLSRKWDAAQKQFLTEACFINGFQKPGP